MNQNILIFIVIILVAFGVYLYASGSVEMYEKPQKSPEPEKKENFKEPMSVADKRRAGIPQDIANPSPKQIRVKNPEPMKGDPGKPMKNQYSQERTDDNVDFVRDQISQKNSLEGPYYATGNIVENSINDMDHFPYDRYYRGIPDSDCPVVMEREAGYRKQHDYAYTPCPHLPPDIKPKFTFQTAGSVIFPANPSNCVTYVG